MSGDAKSQEQDNSKDSIEGQDSMPDSEDNQSDQNDQNNQSKEDSSCDSKDNSHVRTSFTDEELDAALANFEREFDVNNIDSSSNVENSNESSRSSSTKSEELNNSDNLKDGNQIPEAIDMTTLHRSKEAEEAAKKFEENTSFEDTLEGLTGQKARSAVISTYVNKADLLAAFCKISKISAICVTSETGSIAILRNLNNDEPECAVVRLSELLGPVAMILLVNRANKLDVSVYEAGKTKEMFLPAPLALTILPDEVADVVLGVSAMKDFQLTDEIFDSEKLTFNNAMSICNKYFTKFGM